MTRETDVGPVEEGPSPAGAVAPARNPEDGTPTEPAADPRDEPGMTEPLADALDKPVEAGEEIVQPAEGEENR